MSTVTTLKSTVLNLINLNLREKTIKSFYSYSLQSKSKKKDMYCKCRITDYVALSVLFKHTLNL